MARRRQPSERVREMPLMPRELIDTDYPTTAGELYDGARSRRQVLEQRREWFEAYGLTTWAQQYQAQKRARTEYGIPDPPDPREFFRQLETEPMALQDTKEY